MSTLFDVEQGATVEVDELFGSVLPAGYVLRDTATDADTGDVIRTARMVTSGLAGKDPEKSTIAKVKRYDHRKHYPRAEKAMQALFPGAKLWRADYVQPTHSGALITKDTLGFADVMGAVPPNGRIIAVQITTYGQIAAHLRKYTDPKKTVGSGMNPTTIEQHLREFLAVGGRFFILGFVLPEGSRFWEHEMVEVDARLLDEYKARKRRKG